MKKLLVDLDYVICINNLIEKVNEFFETTYTKENFPSLYLNEVFTNEEKLEEFLNLHSLENYYIKPYIFPDCKRVLKQLSKYYEIYICTAYVWQNMPNNTKTELCAKLDFLYKTFDFINPKNIVFCSDKSILSGDVIIDDRLKNLSGNSKIKLLFSSIYNKNLSDTELSKSGATRVNSWEEIKNLLMKIK